MSEPSDLEPCFSCGALVPKTEGATHDCMLSSPGCRAVWGARSGHHEAVELRVEALV